MGSKLTERIPSMEDTDWALGEVHEYTCSRAHAGGFNHG
jgi:hypothetical protein